MTVLVIDDNVEILDITKRFLQKNNIAADVASGGILGLEMLLKNPDKYSLVLLDIHMQDMDGYHVLKQIRANGNCAISKMPVIAVSGEMNGADCIDFNYYLHKPLNFKEFIPSIYKVLEKAMAIEDSADN